MSTIATNLGSATLEPTSDSDIAHAIGLLAENLLTPAEFKALTGIDAQSIQQRLADPAMLAAVQRAAIHMRNSGALARFEAARHARAAVEVAASIMSDNDMHPTHRISAATLIARTAGTDKPSSEEGRPSERFRVVIHLGDDRPPTVIESGCISGELDDQR